MPLSQIAKSIGASPTLKLNAQAARMKAAGEPVVHLGGGEPESLAPPSAVRAGAAMLETGGVRYTPAAGTPAMREAIIRYTERFYGRRVEPTNVMASAGAKQAIMVALMALLDPGDEVIFPVPYWVSYPDMTRLAAGVPVAVRAADGGFQPSAAEIEAAVTPRTRAILLNSPNNPSGRIYDERFIRDMVALCERRDITLLMDDIYHRLVFDGARALHAYECTQRSVDQAKIVVFNGVSKQYAMTGFRLGWAVGPRDLIAAMSNIQSHQSGGPCSVSQVAAAAAIDGPQDSVDGLRDTLQRGRDEMVGLLAEVPGVKVAKPAGTFYCFCDFSAVDRDSTRLAALFLEKLQVVTVPGVEFGMDGFLRLSFCGPLADVREGVRRIKWLLDARGPATLDAGGRVITR